MSEFFEEQTIQAGEVGAMQGGEVLPDMDSLFEQAVNQDEVRQTQSDALKPAGSYVTTPRLNLQAGRQKVSEFTALPGGGDTRLTFRFFGPAALTVTEKNSAALRLPVGSVVKGQFGFAMSPERGNKVKNGQDSGEPDGQSQMWAQAVKAYEIAHKQKPRTWGDVVRYVENYPVVLRVIQMNVPSERNPEPDGEPRNLVMALSPVREERASL